MTSFSYSTQHCRWVAAPVSLLCTWCNWHWQWRTRLLLSLLSTLLKTFHKIFSKVHLLWPLFMKCSTRHGVMINPLFDTAIVINRCQDYGPHIHTHLATTSNCLGKGTQFRRSNGDISFPSWTPLVACIIVLAPPSGVPPLDGRCISSTAGRYRIDRRLF